MKQKYYILTDVSNFFLKKGKISIFRTFLHLIYFKSGSFSRSKTAELASEIGISPLTLRDHLLWLIRQGLVVKGGKDWIHTPSQKHIIISRGHYRSQRIPIPKEDIKCLKRLRTYCYGSQIIAAGKNAYTTTAKRNSSHTKRIKTSTSALNRIKCELSNSYVQRYFGKYSNSTWSRHRTKLSNLGGIEIKHRFKHFQKEDSFGKIVAAYQELKKLYPHYQFDISKVGDYYYLIQHLAPIISFDNVKSKAYTLTYEEEQHAQYAHALINRR